MAGTNADFNAAEFNEALHFVMDMAAPLLTADRAKFYFARTVDPDDLTVAEDGVPFLAANEPDGSTAAPVTVQCVIEGLASADEDSNIGLLRPSKLTVTLLDAEYLQVKGCAYMVVAGDRYDYRATDPPIGLFDAGVWTMHFAAFKDT